MSRGSVATSPPPDLTLNERDRIMSNKEFFASLKAPTRPENLFIDPEGIYQVQVASTEDPLNIKDFSVKLNHDRVVKKPLQQTIEIPGWAILILWDAGREKEEFAPNRDGMLERTGNIYKECRFALNIFKRVDQKGPEVMGPLPVSYLKMKSQYEDMTVEELRKEVRIKLKDKVPSELVKSAKKEVLIVLLTGPWED